MKHRIAVYAGTRNVFADLGLADDEDLSSQAELARLIYVRIKRLRFTQAEITTLLGLKQSDVSKLMNGRHSGFSRERLSRFLKALN